VFFLCAFSYADAGL